MPASRIIACPTCNAVVSDGDRFCKSCGTEVSGISASYASGQSTPWASGASPVLAETSPWEGVLARLREVTASEFIVGRELGRGGMAAVFLAQDLALSRKVAIKVMAPGIMLGEGMVARFRQEAITIANLQHANIVTVHAVRQLADLHFFVMQFVEGQSLEGVLRDQHALPVSIVRPILHQVGSALAYAHRRGVIHRDIKPGNILLSADGDALVTDFGIAKVAEGPTQTQTGMVVGTPTYMSPEQCYATELDGSSDQYSLGIVAYQMLAGRTPFTGSAFAIMRGHTTEPVPPIREFAPDVPEQVENAILRMLAKKPADRFASFGEALAAMGAQPIGEDSAIRAEMIRLAAVQERMEALGDLLRTPSSPISGTRSGARPGATPRTPSPATQQPPAIAIAIAPLPEELEIGEELPLRATVRGSTNPSALEWSTETPSIVQISANGVMQAVAQGEAVVLARLGAVVDRASLLVVPPRAASVRLKVPEGDVHVGESFVLSADVVDKRGQLLPVTPEWSAVGSSLRVDPSGTAYALAAGRTAVTAGCEGQYDTVVIQVLPARVAALEILAPTSQLEIGHAVTFVASARDANGAALENRAVQWSVKETSRARIDAAGVFTALDSGSVTVRAHCEGREATIKLEVPPARAHTVSISNMPEIVRDGDRFKLSAVARDVRGAVLQRDMQWTSSKPSVATIDRKGEVRALAAGATEISVSVDDAVATSRLVVHATPAAFVAPDPSLGAQSPAASATAVLSALEPAPASASVPASVPASVSASVPASVPASSSATSAPPVAVSPGASTTSAPARKRPVWMIGAAAVPVALLAWVLMSGGDDQSAATAPATVATDAGATDAPAASPGSPPTSAAPAGQAVADSVPPETAGSSAAALRLTTPASTTLRPSESLRLRASTVDRASGREVRGSINFSSSDRSVATVNRTTGEVTAAKPGRVTITADAGDAGRQSVQLTVLEADAPVVAERRPDPAPTTPQQQQQQQQPQLAPPVAAAPANTTATTPPPAAEPAVPSQEQLAREARTLIDSYARAFSSRDVNRLRALNPSLAAGDRDLYADMFRNSDSVRVTLKSMNVTSANRRYDPTDGANTNVAASFDFVFYSKNRSIGRQASEVSWAITLQRESDAWKLLRISTP